MAFTIVRPIATGAQVADSQPTQLTFSRTDFIAELSGHQPYTNDNKLASRYTRRQRLEAANFLVKTFSLLGIQASLKPYRAANVNFAVDLILPPMQGNNVVAVIPSTNASQSTVIIGAHYDSNFKSPGADDNATGVAAVFSVAEALVKLPYRGHNFVLVLFDQEEEGEVGSTAYVKAIVRDNIELHSMHNIDMIGWDANQDKVVELDVNSTELEELYLASAKKFDIKVIKQQFSSDHKPFEESGFAVAALSENFSSGDLNPNYHSETDTYEYINFAYVDLTTRWLIDVVSQLAGH